MLKKKKKRIKNLKRKNGLAKIANFTTKSLGNVLSNYRKSKELEKIKIIKLQKLKEKNQILKEKKDLRTLEEKLIKESNKIKEGENKDEISNDNNNGDNWYDSAQNQISDLFGSSNNKD